MLDMSYRSKIYPMFNISKYWEASYLWRCEVPRLARKLTLNSPQPNPPNGGNKIDWLKEICLFLIFHPNVVAQFESLAMRPCYSRIRVLPHPKLPPLFVSYRTNQWILHERHCSSGCLTRLSWFFVVVVVCFFIWLIYSFVCMCARRAWGQFKSLI